MDRGRQRGNATSENPPLFLSSLPRTSPEPTRSQHKITIKEERTGRQTRGPTLSCQSRSLTEPRISHDPLQRARCYDEHVRHVNAFMQLPHAITSPSGFPFSSYEKKTKLHTFRMMKY